jgi:hypothetical protein
MRILPVRFFLNNAIFTFNRVVIEWPEILFIFIFQNFEKIIAEYRIKFLRSLEQKLLHSG